MHSFFEQCFDATCKICRPSFATEDFYISPHNGGKSALAMQEIIDRAHKEVTKMCVVPEHMLRAYRDKFPRIADIWNKNDQQVLAMTPKKMRNEILFGDWSVNPRTIGVDWAARADRYSPWFIDGKLATPVVQPQLNSKGRTMSKDEKKLPVNAAVFGLQNHIAAQQRRVAGANDAVRSHSRTLTQAIDAAEHEERQLAELQTALARLSK